MDGRGARVGVSLLVVAALVVVLPVLLRPRLVDGVATAAPMPEPPQVGDCLALDRRQVVSCDGPHYSEVTERWTADDPERWADSTPDRCERRGQDYMSLDEFGSPPWQISIDARAEQVDAPAAERVRTRGWTICTITVSSGGLYEGSLRDLTETDRPWATATCSRGDDRLSVPCDQPHDTEELAWTWQEVADPVGAATPLGPDGFYDFDAELRWPDDLDTTFQAQCAQVAATVLEAADPTRGGVLRSTFRPSVFSAALDDPGTAVVVGMCVIGSADGRQLVGSLIGLGDAAPTFS